MHDRPPGEAKQTTVPPIPTNNRQVGSLMFIAITQTIAMRNNTEIIKALFEQMMSPPLVLFPNYRGRLEAPFDPGVYVIYSAKRKVLYVGRTPRGGIYFRLTNHLHGVSPLANKYFDGDCSRLRLG